MDFDILVSQNTETQQSHIGIWRFSAGLMVSAIQVEKQKPCFDKFENFLVLDDEMGLFHEVLIVFVEFIRLYWAK